MLGAREHAEHVGPGLQEGLDSRGRRRMRDPVVDAGLLDLLERLEVGEDHRQLALCEEVGPLLPGIHGAEAWRAALTDAPGHDVVGVHRRGAVGDADRGASILAELRLPRQHRRRVAVGAAPDTFALVGQPAGGVDELVDRHRGPWRRVRDAGGIEHGPVVEDPHRTQVGTQAVQLPLVRAAELSVHVGRVADDGLVVGRQVDPLLSDQVVQGKDLALPQPAQIAYRCKVWWIAGRHCRLDLGRVVVLRERGDLDVDVWILGFEGFDQGVEILVLPLLGHPEVEGDLLLRSSRRGLPGFAIISTGHSWRRAAPRSLPSAGDRLHQTVTPPCRRSRDGWQIRPRSRAAMPVRGGSRRPGPAARAPASAPP